MNIKDNSGSRNGAMRRGLFFLGVAVVIALVLFNRSLAPGQVHFSNDAPLGVRESQSQRQTGLSGSWSDLNTLGASSGALSPNLYYLLHELPPVILAKWFPAIALVFFGSTAWFFFRQLKLASIACILGGLAAMLNSAFFSAACWGVAAHPVSIGFDFLALAALVDSRLRSWVKLPLAGFAVGMSVAEGYDIGAILSLLVAAFAFYQAWVGEGNPGWNLVKGIGRVALVAFCAAFLAAQTIVALVGSQITGIAGTGQDSRTKAERWDFATQWSLPKTETISLFVPGLFGYRMDTPEGGNYWGAIGREPAWDRYFAGGKQGAPPPGPIRYSGGGAYFGVLVLVVAVWAASQSLRKKDSVFNPAERRFLWFWMGALVISLLLAFGRFAPFYRLLYKLPFFSTIRNPTKFLYVFTFALLVIFAYGIHGLSKRYLEISLPGASGVSARLKSWWTKAGAFDRRWVAGCLLAVAASLLGWLIYFSSRSSLEQYLQTVHFDESIARAIAAFSIKQVGWFILFLTASVGLVLLILSGAFAGRRAPWAGFLLGLVLVVDLARANLPWIQYVDYVQKYASNPIVDFLRDKPYEHRVAILPFRLPPQLSVFEQVYGLEWAQHHFPYYNIQSLDIVQMPRMPADLLAFETALRFSGTPESVYRLTRRWMLTNTRYLLGSRTLSGPVETLDVLNQQVDPERHRFRIARTFNLVPKPGILDATSLEELTAEPAGTTGAYAVFEFTGALPRAGLYSNWEMPINDPVALNQLRATSLGTNELDFLKSAGTNDYLTLKKLADPGFDPQQTVLLASPLPAPAAVSVSNQNPGTVEFTSYASKDIKLKTKSDAPTVLLLNDRYDPNWQVQVDGKPAELLRCNYIMRGVYLTAGPHTVEFRFRLESKTLLVSLAAIVIGALLLGYAIFSKNKPAP